MKATNRTVRSKTEPPTRKRPAEGPLADTGDKRALIEEESRKRKASSDPEELLDEPVVPDLPAGSRS